MSKQYKTG